MPGTHHPATGGSHGPAIDMPCNQSLSKDEEYVREIFSLAGTNEAAEQVFDGVVRNYSRPQSPLLPQQRADRLLKKMSPADLFSPGGLYLGKALKLSVEPQRINRVMEKIGKGLYYYYLKQRVPDSFTVEAKEVNLAQALEMTRFPVNYVEKFDDIFIHRGTRYRGEESFSAIWQLGFFHRVLYRVFIEAPSIETLRERYWESLSLQGSSPTEQQQVVTGD
jgi:hypothetical protein